jgi:homoserine kinase type II
MTRKRPLIDPAALSQVVRRYPQMGSFTGVTRNGLAVNTAACLFETSNGIYFAKRYDPRVREAAALNAEHRITLTLLAAGYPTPHLHANNRGDTLTWLAEIPYALYDLARGEPKYADAPVFSPYTDLGEVRSAGAMLARFHKILMGVDVPPPRPFAGLTAQFKAWEASTLAEGLAPLLAGAPALETYLAKYPAWLEVLSIGEARHPAINAALPSLPRGILHGDWIKRNLFFMGHEVSDVCDFELWNSGVLLYDVALALLPIGFNWPELLAGTGKPDGRAMAEFIAGYETVRALESAERAALPLVMEGARLEFYLSGVAMALDAHDAHQAALFWEVLTGSVHWFAANPGWREIMA